MEARTRRCVESVTLVYPGVFPPTVASEPPGDSVSHPKGFFFVGVDGRRLHFVRLLSGGGAQAHPLGVASEPPGDSESHPDDFFILMHMLEAVDQGQPT